LPGAVAALLQMGQDMHKYTDCPHYDVGCRECPFHPVLEQCNLYHIVSLHPPGYSVTSYRVPIKSNVIWSKVEEKVRLG